MWEDNKERVREPPSLIYQRARGALGRDAPLKISPVGGICMTAAGLTRLGLDARRGLAGAACQEPCPRARFVQIRDGVRL